MELVLAAEGSAPDTALGPQQESNEALLLNLPGKSLDVSFWVHQKRKFRNRGGIEAALQALKNLQEDGMGELQSKKMKGTVKAFHFHKTPIPEDPEGKAALGKKLAEKYNLSLLQYSRAFNDDTMVKGGKDKDAQ